MIVVVTPAGMILIVPVPLGAPAMLVFVPPAMPVRPAVLSRLVQLMTSMLGLLALVSMVFNGLMQTVIGAGNPVLAIIVRSQAGSASEKQETRHDQGRSPTPIGTRASKHSE